MAKLTDFETPLGQKGNLFNPGSWIPLITGTVVLLFTFAMGQKVGNILGAKIPLINTHPQAPFQPIPQPAAASSDIYIG